MILAVNSHFAPVLKNDFGLQYYFLGKDDPSLPAVFILHGYGADAKDLIPLITYRDFHRHSFGDGKSARYFFLQGPGVVPISPYQQGYAWWDLDMEELFRWAQTRDYSAIAHWRPAGLDAIADKVRALVEKESAQASKVILGGFSQGAITSLEVALRGLKLDALILLSSTWLSEKVWLAGMEKFPLPPVFQSHGRMDPILPFGAAEQLHRTLIEKKVPTEFHPFQGGHEIPLPVLENLHTFLTRAMA